MVVTRRAPIVPPQQPARNHAAQATQRPPRTSLPKETTGVSRSSGSSTATASHAGSSDELNKDQRNGLDDSSGKKSRRSRRHNKAYPLFSIVIPLLTNPKNKYQKSNFQALLDFLTKLLVLAFTIYMFSVCPQDTHLQSPICRGLSEYKRLVLDPYIIPPIQAALAHPSIAPHIEHATPYVHRAVEITTPILVRAQQGWNLHVVPQWERRIVPEWNNRVVPQWNKHVVPQWDKYVAPRIQLVQSTLEPYRLRVTQTFEQRVAPHVHVAIYNLQRWQRQAEPYVLLAVSRTKDGYHAAKPYAVPLAKRCGHLLQRFALFLREQRQTFVDPHVAKMWEKVKELSRGRQVVYETAPERESLSPDTLSTILDTLGYETVVSPTSTFTSAYHAIPIPEPTDVAFVSSSLGTGKTTEIQPTFTPVPVSTATGQFVVTDESFPSAQAVLTEPLVEPDPLTLDASLLAKEPDTATSTVSVDTTTASSSIVSSSADGRPTAPVSSPAKNTIPAASATVAPVISRVDDEIDFDAFYAELGLDESLGNPGAPGGNSVPPSEPAETEEERSERLRRNAEETARKRADIEARQIKWEAELQAQTERSTLQLQNRLSHLRAAAAADLSSSTEVRRSIEELVSEAEKYLKGAEIYLKNLKGESRRADEKLALWDRVAERVSDKFSERMLATEGVVNAWYKIVLDKELDEVTTASAAVRDVAEKGQLDLGLDYAWLEDVTYEDWQGYHALIATSERYADEAASIQQGTHPKVVVMDPMSPVLQDVESEVQDVVIGFETRLRRIKREGERAFSNQGNGNGQKEEDKGSSVEPETEAEPQVSILPVPREGEQGFVPPVIIGRSREEVLEALDKVGVSEQGMSRSHVDPEEAVSQLVREEEGGIGHTEL